jgi:hypothetical protein
MNMATEPTAPTMKAAGQIIAMIILKASIAGLCSRSWRAPVVAGFWATVSRMMFRMMKRTKPSIDARRRNLNFLAVRQGWTNARTKAVAARKANSMPGGLSSIPTAAAAIANKPQITKRISVLILLCGVEKASIKIVSFFDSGFRLWLPYYESTEIFS